MYLFHFNYKNKFEMGWIVVYIWYWDIYAAY